MHRRRYICLLGTLGKKSQSGMSGFVKFVDHAMAVAAIEKLNHLDFTGEGARTIRTVPRAA